MIDIDKVRLETPACAHLTHFNNAGCSLMPLPVREKMFDYLQSEQYAGGYETAVNHKADLAEMYQSIARLINCDSTEIAFCESNTRGWQQFFYSLDFSSRGNIITSRVDYGSNFVAYIHASKKFGMEIRYIDTDEQGDLDLDHLTKLIDAKTKLISISHIPTGNGLVNSAEDVGEIAWHAGVPFLLDASQSVGHLQVDVAKIRCTALTATGRKYLRGARGTGILYVSQDYCKTAVPAYLEQHSAELIDDSNYRLADGARRFENFESHFGGKIALKEAADYAVAQGVVNIENRIFNLSRYCRPRLQSVNGVTVCDTGSLQCGIVTFDVIGHSAAKIRGLLGQESINTWVSTGSGSLVEFQDRGLDAINRASLHYFNTETEIDGMCSVLQDLKIP